MRQGYAQHACLHLHSQDEVRFAKLIGLLNTKQMDASGDVEALHKETAS